MQIRSGQEAISSLVAWALQNADVSEVVSTIAHLCEYDRYQASCGIEKAAAYIAETAKQLGVAEVTVETFRHPQDQAWWTFRNPQSWTPINASFDLRIDGQSLLKIDHSVVPFSLATNSAPTEQGGIRSCAVLDMNAQDRSHEHAVLVLDHVPPQDELDRLAKAGASGFITDAACRRDRYGNTYPGRIELPEESKLFAFSITTVGMDIIRAAMKSKHCLHVDIQIARDAGTPLVCGLLPGDVSKPEIWLTAHLCHPRPSANDNASGVASLLALIPLLRNKSPTRSPIRFFWGPEFVGMAAALHRRVTQEKKIPLPSSVLNLDMVGEDQKQCGGPFVVERPPSSITSFDAILAESIVQEVFIQTQKVPGTWLPTAYIGYSDHALFVDEPFLIPAIQFCHIDDRFNHSAADDISRVSPAELRRAIASAAAFVEMSSDPTRYALQDHKLSFVKEWSVKFRRQAEQVAIQYADVEEGDWSQAFQNYTEHYLRNLAKLADGAEITSCASRRHNSVQRCWIGPFNLRAMLNDLQPEWQAVAKDLLQKSRRNGTIMFGYACRINGIRTVDEILWETSFDLGHPIHRGLASSLISLFFKSGWAAQDDNMMPI